MQRSFREQAQGIGAREILLRCGLECAFTSAHHDNFEVETLQLARLLAEAEGGVVSASKLLRALEADRRKLKALLAEQEA